MCNEEPFAPSSPPYSPQSHCPVDAPTSPRHDLDVFSLTSGSPQSWVQQELESLLPEWLWQAQQAIQTYFDNQMAAFRTMTTQEMSAMRTKRRTLDDQHEKVISEMKSDIKAMAESLCNSMNYHSSVNRGVVDVHEILSTHNNMIRTLGKRVQAMEEHLNGVCTEQGRLIEQACYTVAQKRVDTLEEKFNILDDRICEVGDRVVDVEKEASDLEKRVCEVEDRVVDVEKQVCEVEDRVVDVEREASDVEKRVCEVEDRVVDIEKEASDLERRVCEAEEIECMSDMDDYGFSVPSEAQGEPSEAMVVIPNMLC